MPARVTDSELIARIRSAGEGLGRTPRSSDVPGWATAVKRWGTWNAALSAAGFKPNRPYSDDDLLSALRRVFDAQGRISSTLMDDLPDVPSSMAYLRRFGSFRKACALAGVPEHHISVAPGTFEGKLDNYLRRMYGIGAAEYEALLAKQGGGCAICGAEESIRSIRNRKVERLSVDHCHDTGRVRGLLCGSCNRLIGQALDSPGRLRAAADYLEAEEA